MAKISVELRSGTARFAVAVQAPTIQQALDVAAARFPGNLSGGSPRPRVLFYRGMCRSSGTDLSSCLERSKE